MKFRIGWVCCCLIILAACQSEKQKLANKIKETETALKSDTTGVMDFKKALEIVKLYEEYADKNSADTMSAKYLFKAADVSAHSHNVHHAVELYKRLIKEYPDYKNVPQAWFYIGFLYQNELLEIDSAKMAYNTLLTHYPKFEQAETARWLLENINKSDEEIVRQFEANAQQTDTVSTVAK